MSFLHIIGFGAQPRLQLRVRRKWHSNFPSASLKIEPSDAVVVNLIEIHDHRRIEELRCIVEYIGEHGGTICLVCDY